MRTPPFGKQLAERLKFANTPLFVVICLGLNAWKRAKKWNKGRSDTPALVLTPDVDPKSLAWPVADCQVIIEYDEGPGNKDIEALVAVLWRDGAEMISTRPLQTDLRKNLWEWQPDKGLVLVQQVPQTVCRRRSQK